MDAIPDGMEYNSWWLRSSRNTSQSIISTRTKSASAGCAECLPAQAKITPLYLIKHLSEQLREDAVDRWFEPKQVEELLNLSTIYLYESCNELKPIN